MHMHANAILADRWHTVHVEYHAGASMACPSERLCHDCVNGRLFFDGLCTELL